MQTAHIGKGLSYGDRANPRKPSTVVAIEDNGDTSEGVGVRVFEIGARGLVPAGRHLIVVDDEGNISDTYENSVRESTDPGNGGWRWSDEPDKLPEYAAELYQVAQVKRAARYAQQNEAAKRRTDEEEAFNAKVQAVRPEWAKAVIIAELERDNCDCQSDYFATTTERRLMLAWSRHTRDLFPELRAAAAKAEETKHLSTAGPDAEHREKWSMGHGYYLKATGRYDTGWRVLKSKDLNFRHYYRAEVRL